MYLVWLHLNLDKQVLALLSRDVVFENSEATRSPNADIPVIFLSLAFCRPKKSGIPNLFFAYVEFVQILIKIMQVYYSHAIPSGARSKA
jgi:hypothetical protein